MTPPETKDVLITGAGGFIGGRVVREGLRRGYRIHALVHREKPRWLLDDERIRIQAGDIRDAGWLEMVFSSLPRLKAVIHCAAKASDVGRDKDFRGINYDAVRTIGALSLKHQAGRMVFISTTDVYGLRDFNGEGEDELPLARDCRNPYPKYKIMAEDWIRTHLPPERFCLIRPAAVWGEDDPTLTRRIRDFLAWSPAIVHFGRWRGENRWPAVRVEKVAQAAWLGALLPEAGGLAVNVLDSERISVDGFYRRVAARFFPGKKFRTLYLPMWCGLPMGAASSALSNLFKLSQPLWDPTLYALYSVGLNLDFSSARLEELSALDPSPASLSRPEAL